jgi:glutathione S-transferase
MIHLYGFAPAWGLPCVSPFVTKVANYLTMAGLPHEMRWQNLYTLKRDSPSGKLPYIEDGPNQVADSTRILQYLQEQYGDPLDADLSDADRAVGLAFQRMVEEYTYWSGIIQPRWRHLASFEQYIEPLAGPEGADPELRSYLLGFRRRVVDQMEKQGMGLRSDDDVQQCLREDVDALADYLADKPFFLGAEPSSFDATIYATVRHIADSPWDWPGRDHLRGRRNLMAYAARMRERFEI